MRNDIPKRRARRLAAKCLRLQLWRGNPNALLLAAALNLDVQP